MTNEHSYIASIVHDEHRMVISLAGEIDLANVDAIAAAVYDAIPNTVEVVVVDLAATAYLDSAGLNLLAELRERLLEHQQFLHVVAPQGTPARRALSVAGLEHVLSVLDEHDHA